MLCCLLRFRLQWISDCHDPGLIPIWRCRTAQASNATITWEIPANQSPGEYRIVHYGAGHTEEGTTIPYEGVSGVFSVESATHKYFPW